MKVFRMNDYDWVCAESEEQAKEFYKNECGLDYEEINEYFVGEVSLQDEMMIEVGDLPIEEQKQTQKFKEYAGTLFAYKTFEWVIKNENITEPCIISSTEY
ncbi:hypothetical protein LCM23_25270 [Cytobacillus kochii]|uniref:hypothetical protein n=1 Tax=Cytobacillus kochii TaxID=859143 RepID=UPI001CD7928B|nr:hypothetical protein [Cytobacillus kochii]MCA1029327.1 hypothetical protein [Cytobacillus kochii]